MDSSNAFCTGGTSPPTIVRALSFKRRTIKKTGRVFVRCLMKRVPKFPANFVAIPNRSVTYDGVTYKTPLLPLLMAHRDGVTKVHDGLDVKDVADQMRRPSKFYSEWTPLVDNDPDYTAMFWRERGPYTLRGWTGEPRPAGYMTVSLREVSVSDDELIETGIYRYYRSSTYGWYDSKDYEHVPVPDPGPDPDKVMAALRLRNWSTADVNAVYAVLILKTASADAAEQYGVRITSLYRHVRQIRGDLGIWVQFGYPGAADDQEGAVA